MLTVEATGLLPAIFVAKALGLPVVFARKSRQIGVCDSYQASPTLIFRACHTPFSAPRHTPFSAHVTPHFPRTSHPISPARHTPFPPHFTPHFPRTSQAIHLLHTSHAIPRTSHPICPIICHRHFFRARPHTSRTRSLRRRISTCPPSISSLETAFSSSTTSLLGGAPPTPW